MEADLMHVTAFARQQRSLKLFNDFNTLQFASIMGIVIFVVLVFFMTAPTPHGNGGIDVPRVLQPISMPGADREDAIKILISRDGHIYIGADWVSPTDVSKEISDRLKDPDVEHKAYIKADARARWGTVKLVLQGVHDAGIARVGFLADQRHLH